MLHLPKPTPIFPRIFLRLEVLVFPFEAVLLDNPRPAIHDHFELDVTCHRTGPLHQTAAALALMVIVNPSSLHLLGQEADAEQTLVGIDWHIARRFLANRIKPKLLARDARCKKIPRLDRKSTRLNSSH